LKKLQITITYPQFEVKEVIDALKAQPYSDRGVLGQRVQRLFTHQPHLPAIR
jgi:hypothetical protein